MKNKDLKEIRVIKINKYWVPFSHKDKTKLKGMDFTSQSYTSIDLIKERATIYGYSIRIIA